MRRRKASNVRNMDQRVVCDYSAECHRQRKLHSSASSSTFTHHQSLERRRKLPVFPLCFPHCARGALVSRENSSSVLIAPPLSTKSLPVVRTSRRRRMSQRPMPFPHHLKEVTIRHWSKAQKKARRYAKCRLRIGKVSGLEASNPEKRPWWDRASSRQLWRTK